MFKDYVEVREWLESFIPLVYGKSELGLARISNLLLKLGNPQKKFKSILVGGTAGKGSTAFYISRLLQFAGPVRTFPPVSAHLLDKSNGDQKNSVELCAVLPAGRQGGSPSSSATRNYKIGLHLSPHLIYIGERMQVNGVPISFRRLVGLVNEIKPVVDGIKSKQPELTPSYFEILVALSFLYFAKEKVEWAIVEVGLGGRLDATNILESEISVITNVGLDHTELLGDTVEEIALEKAGIIKAKVLEVSNGSKASKGIPVVTGATGKALKVIEKVAKNKDSLLININTQYRIKDVKSDILRHIARHENLFNREIDGFVYLNKKIAIYTVLALGLPLTKYIVKKAFSAKFAGRFEEINKGIIVDGAHNTDKIRALINAIGHWPLVIRKSTKAKRLKAKGITLVLAFKKGKNWQEMVDQLMKNLPIEKVIATKYQAVTDTGKGSSVEPEEIARYVTNDKRLMTKAKVIKNSQEAVFKAMQVSYSSSERSESRSSSKEKFSTRSNYNLVLVTGSLYLVGEARTLWKLPDF